MVDKNGMLSSYLDDVIKSEIHSLKKYKSNKRVIGSMCLFMPRELIASLNLAMVYLPTLSNIKENKAARLSKIEQLTFCDTICNHSKFSYIDDVPEGYPRPEVFIFPTTCDPFTRLFEHMSEHFEIRLLSLPRNRESQTASDYWYEEIVSLIDFLEKKFDVKYDETKLRKAVEVENKIRSLMSAIMATRKLQPSPISSNEARKIQVMYQEVEREKCIEVFSNILEMVNERIRNNHFAYHKDNPRMLLVTTTTRDFEVGTEKEKKTTLEVIDDSGCAVVVEDACSTQSYVKEISTEGDILKNLCDFYLKEIYCPCFLDNERHLKDITNMISEYHVDGVIFRSIKGCRHFEGKINKFKKTLDNIGVPMLYFETTGIINFGIGRLETQIESFAEMLRRKNKKED